MSERRSARRSPPHRRSLAPAGLGWVNTGTETAGGARGGVTAGLPTACVRGNTSYVRTPTPLGREISVDSSAGSAVWHLRALPRGFEPRTCAGATSRSSVTSASSSRPEAARCCAIRGSRPRTSGRGSRFPRNDGLDPARVRGARLPLHLAPAPRSLRSASGSRATSTSGAAGAAARRSASPFLAPRAAGARLRALRARRGTASRVDLDGLDGRRSSRSPTPADGPLGDSLIVLDDGTARVLNQNDARPGDLDALRALGPFDAQIVQFSGAIWYPIVVRLPARAKARLARDKRVEPDGARRGSTSSGSTPRTCSRARGRRASSTTTCSRSTTSTDDPATSSPTRPCSSSVLARRGDRPRRAARARARSSSSTAASARSTHPGRRRRRREPFADKRAYLDEYRRDWARWLAAERASWSHGRRDLVAELAAWFEPLLRAGADHVGRASRATSCSTSASPTPTSASTSSSPSGAGVGGRAVRLQGRRRPRG